MTYKDNVRNVLELTRVVKKVYNFSTMCMKSKKYFKVTSVLGSESDLAK